MNELSKQKENLQHQLEMLKEQAQQSLIKPETVKEFLENTMEILESLDLEKCQKLCKNYIDKVTVTDNQVKVEVLFSIPDKNCVYHNGVGDGT